MMRPKDGLRVIDPSKPTKRTAGFHLLVAIMALSLMATAIYSGTRDGVPNVMLLIPLVVLVMCATHREAFFGDETAISGSIVVIAGAIVAFRSDAPLFGPTLCGIAAGMHWAHLRQHCWTKVVVNSAATGFAAVLGAATFAVIASEKSSFATVATAVAVSVVVYWLVDNILIAIVLTVVAGRDFREGVTELISAESVMVLFGIAGGLSAMAFASHGPVLGSAALVALLVVVDRNVLAAVSARKSIGHKQNAFASRLMRVTALAFAVGASARVAAEGVLLGLGVGVAVGCIVSFLVAFVAMHRRIGVWDQHLALGVAVADLPAIVVAAGGGVLAVSVAIWAGLVFLLAAFGANLVLTRRRRRAIAHTAADDVRVAAAIELAVAEGTDLSSVPR